jgi:hypothetical protein
MNKLTKDKQQKLMIVAGATVGVVVLLWFVLVSPLRTKLGTLTQQADEAREKVAQGKRSLAAAPQVTNELAATVGQLQAAEGAMAAGDLYDWMIRTMNRFKASQAIDIPQISRETPGEVGLLPRFPYRTASFSIRGTAFYHDLGKFLADLENSFPYVQVQNLQLSSTLGPKPEDDEHLQFSLELVTLVKPVTP